MEKIKLGIVGFGFMGHCDADMMATFDDIDLVAVADTNPEQLKDAPEGVETYANIDEMLANADINVVMVSTPNPSHPEMVKKAAAAKKHVICEKPAAMSVAEYDEMVAACEENGVISMNGNEELLGARFEIDFHLLAEYMESMQLLFWCNSVADKNAAYADLREVFDHILSRYFEKDEKSALDLQALYFQAAHILTSNFLVKADDTRLNMDDSQDRQRVRRIQNYIQANYQSQISCTCRMPICQNM